MFAETLISVLESHADKDAVVWRSKTYSASDILLRYHSSKKLLAQNKIVAGSIVSLEADFSPETVSMLVALIDTGCVIVPLVKSTVQLKPEYRDIAEVEFIVSIDDQEGIEVRNTGRAVQHWLLAELKKRRVPGLILFSSGSTGKSKASVHDFVPLLEKFKVRRPATRMISFLMLDHIGGINTLLAALSSGGCLVMIEDRSPETVLGAIEKFKVEVLPTSPSFINLMLIGQVYERFDLRSLKKITYGTEPMPELTLKRFNTIFPSIEAQQTYGLSELGIFRSKSKSSDSLWVKIGGEGVETRIKDGLLEVKSKSAMLGYLNADSPFTPDGWFRTGDAVEVDGEYIKILGRKSEMINVGGEKVFPAEIESVIQALSGVEEAVVQGEPNPILGSIVKVTVKLTADESLAEFRRRLWEFCKDKLAEYKIPQKIIISKNPLHSERFKKNRA
jgi:long-chain acyl-CoA synthetase